MPCVTAPERRKLLALALASLLTSESPVVLSRVYLVLLNVAETLNDVTRYGKKKDKNISFLKLTIDFLQTNKAASSTA